MPILSSRLTSPTIPQYTEESAAPRPQPHIPTPPINPLLRCPLPNISPPSPDNLRQFYLGGNVPQYRFSPPPPINNNESAPSTATTTTISTTVVKTFSGGSSSSTGTAGITQLTGDVVAGPASGVTPSSVVKVNGGAVPTSQAYVGTNGSGQFVAAIAPANTPAVAHEWTNSYNSSTGAFTQSQPAFGDISGTASWAQLPNPPYRAVTTTYAIQLTDYTVECTSGTFTVTLPAGAALNQRFEITNSGVGVITLAAAAGTINGSATQPINQWATLDVYWNGSNWRIR